MNFPICGTLRKKQFPSTYTALFKERNENNLNIDKGKVTALILLDISASFDTTIHDILSLDV